MPELYTELGGIMPNGYFTRNKIYPLNSVNDAISNLRKYTGNKEIFYCTYIFDKINRDNETKYISPLYFDIDGDIQTDEGFEKLRTALLSLIAFLNVDVNIQYDEIKIYFSGSKGFHIFVNPNVLGIHPSKELSNLYKHFVSYARGKITNGDLIDKKIYDCKRLIRLPNSINAKTGLYKIPLTYSKIKSMRRQNLLELAKKPQQEYITKNAVNESAAKAFKEIIKKAMEKEERIAYTNRNITVTAPQKLPICIKYILTEPQNKGKRNDTLIVLASVLIQNGYRGDDAMSILEGWNAMNNPPLSEHELRATYRSAERMAQEGRGYGCTKLQSGDFFNPQNVCLKCKIYLSKHGG